MFSKNLLALSKIFQVNYPVNARAWDYHFQTEVVVVYVRLFLDKILEDFRFQYSGSLSFFEMLKKKPELKVQYTLEVCYVLPPFENGNPMPSH